MIYIRILRMVCINFGAMTKFISKIINVIVDNLTLSCYHHFRVAAAKLKFRFAFYQSAVSTCTCNTWLSLVD